MVQRKVSSCKLGITIQAHHHPPPAIENLKQSNNIPGSGYQQDGKSYHHGLPDLKKKMKRSGSVRKSTEIQRKPMSCFPVKPPPLPTSPAPATATTTTTPQKSPPNYMKSTTSSEARKEKERAPVCKSLNLDKKHCISSRTNSASPAFSSSSGSGDHKPSPARSSSLKRKRTTVRALTKVPSFKKCSSSKDVRRSTCSSTMKDSKFPPYLVLDDGATEAEGTSVMKVCPYTYCSLNGHHRAPLPPLKCFLKARRRSLKAQKLVGALSPRSRIPATGEIPASLDDVKGIEPDFFVEFFTKGAEIEGPVVDLSEEDAKSADEHNLFDEIPDREDEMIERGFDGGIEDGSMEEDDDGDKSSETTEMEWVQGLDVEGNLCSFEKPEMAKSFDIASNCCTEEILAEELFRDLFEEETEAETATSTATSEGGDPGMADIDGLRNWGSSGSNYDDDDQLSLLQYDAFEEVEETKGEIDDALEANLKHQEPEIDQSCSEIDQDCSDMEDFNMEEPSQVDEILNDSGKEGDLIKPGNVMDTERSVEEEDLDNEYKIRILKATNSDALNDLETKELRSTPNKEEEFHETKDEVFDKSIAEDTVTAAYQVTDNGTSGVSRYQRVSSNQEPDDSCSEWKLKIGSRRAMDDSEETERAFNPKDPNFLPLVPDPEGEKVDLKHQSMDERRNSEEWMIDHALQQTVSKLASARKRKVALLVEAFESVSPILKFDPRIRHPSPVFSPTSVPIQACR